MAKRKQRLKQNVEKFDKHVDSLGKDIESSLKGKRNPLIGAIASLIIPGLGQLYNGETGKGILFIVVMVLFSIVGYYGFYLHILLRLYAAYDAYNKG